MSNELQNAASALWWAGKFSILAARLRNPKFNLIARRFQTEFQRGRVKDKVERLRDTVAPTQPAE